MNQPIAIWYHCLLQINQQRLPAAMSIIQSQMKELETSGLLGAADNFFVGYNGESGSLPYSLIPEKANIIYHGLKCRNELRTLRALEKWLPGHEDWLICWFHSKGATHKTGDSHSTTWRNCMMHHTIQNWRQCVEDLKSGYDSVGTHWMEPPETPDTQYIWAGNMFWATGEFMLTLPSILERAQVRKTGLDSVESRYESEVIWGNGPRLPLVKDYCPGWRPGKPHVNRCDIVKA